MKLKKLLEAIKIWAPLETIILESPRGPNEKIFIRFDQCGGGLRPVYQYIVNNEIFVFWETKEKRYVPSPFQRLDLNEEGWKVGGGLVLAECAFVQLKKALNTLKKERLVG